MALKSRLTQVNRYEKHTIEGLRERAEYVPQLKRCVHKLSKSQKVDLRKSSLKLWTCKRLKFN